MIPSPPLPSSAQAHLGFDEVSAWVRRFAPLVAPAARVLDVACGGGRNSRFFLDRGCRVSAVDRDTTKAAALAERENFELVQADLEDGSPWPFSGRHFDAIVVTNYLYRPLFPCLIESLAEGGVLIYETFAEGNERHGRPRNPDHLLRTGELLEIVRGRLDVVAYEMIEIAEPIAAVVQRICAIKPRPWANQPDARAGQNSGHA